MRSILLVAVAGLSLPTAAHADPSKLVIEVPSLQEASPKPVPEAKAKLICRSDYAIGSLVRKNRWCATADEWRQSERSAKTFTDTVQRDKGRFNIDGPPATDAYVGGNGMVRVGGH